MNGKATKIKWTNLVRRDIERLSVDLNVIYNRDELETLTEISDTIQPLSAKTLRSGVGLRWTQEKKVIYSKRMEVHRGKKEACHS